MNNFLADYIIIGSGPSGVQAAQTLVEAGLNVAIVDAGILSEQPAQKIGPFLQIRQNHSQQYDTWIGKNSLATSSIGIKPGSQLTPARQHANHLADRLTPFSSDSFFPMTSLAKGGLGEAWGLGCCTFSDNELHLAGLPVAEMKKAFQLISDRIGISAANDETLKYTMGNITGVQDPIDIDPNSRELLRKYTGKREHFNKNGFFLGKASLALLTKEKDNRAPTGYDEMDFYNGDEAAYRPAITIKKLETCANFSYVGRLLVTHYEEIDDYVRVYFKNIATAVSGYFDCKKLLLAANLAGTSSIVLRSLHAYDTKLPFLCNHYVYVPCLQWKMLGKTDNSARTATSQLFLFHDPDQTNTDVAMASLYSYRSLMLFRLMGQVPLNSKDGRAIMQWLVPAITIAGIHQPDRFSSSKQLWIEEAPESFNEILLKATASLSPGEKNSIANREKQFLKAFKKLGCFPIKKINPGYGASIHYAGSLPVSKKEEKLRCLPDGRLGLHQNVYIADGCSFGFLPAKGITLSLMANAHRIAEQLVKQKH